MSFSVLYAERARDVKRALSAPFSGGKLGELTRAYLAEVAELVPDDVNLIVKASGHSDANWTSVTIELGCAQPIPPVPAEDPQPEMYKHPAEAAADTPQPGEPVSQPTGIG